MEKFNRGGDRGGFGGNRGGGSRFGGNRGGGFGGNKFGGNRDRGNREVVMNDAICDECHKKCQVPFRPSGDKPVYCSECFGSKRESSPRSSFDNGPRRDFNPRPQRDSGFVAAPKNDDVKKQLDAINIKLDNLIRTVELMSKPTAPKATPVEVKVKKTVKKAK